jgi:hypothetical protein
MDPIDIQSPLPTCLQRNIGGGYIDPLGLKIRDNLGKPPFLSARSITIGLGKGHTNWPTREQPIRGKRRSNVHSNQRSCTHNSLVVVLDQIRMSTLIA